MEFYFLGKRENNDDNSTKNPINSALQFELRTESSAHEQFGATRSHRKFYLNFFLCCLLCSCVWIRLRYGGIIKSINAGRRGAWGESRKRQRHIFILTLQPSAETGIHKKNDIRSFFSIIRRWWSLASYNFSSLNFTLFFFFAVLSPFPAGEWWTAAISTKKIKSSVDVDPSPGELIMSLKNFTNKIFSLARANRVHKGNLLPLFFSRLHHPKAKRRLLELIDDLIIISAHTVPRSDVQWNGLTRASGPVDDCEISLLTTTHEIHSKTAIRLNV